MGKAVMSFSGDPITNGHINIIERALKVFNHLTVAIGENPAKKYTFSLSKRKEMATDVLNKYGDRVTVCSFEGLLVDFAYSHCIDTIVRGIRGMGDVDYEKMMHEINQSQKLGIDTLVLFADQKLSHVSSSAAKELQKHHARNVLDYVPLAVKRELEIAISKQYIIGITGQIGAGKSYVSDMFMKMAHNKGIKAYNIDFDVLGHQILEQSMEPVFIEIRKKFVNKFGKDILNNNGFIDRKKIGSKLWGNSEELSWFNSQLKDGLDYLYRGLLKKYEGPAIIMVNGALLAEFNMTHLVNNDVVIVDAPLDTRKKRLKLRGYSDEEIDKRINNQMSFDSKKKIIEDKINEDECGEYFIINNDDEKNNITSIFDQVLEYLDIQYDNRR